jgi:hypothetical protein
MFLVTGLAAVVAMYPLTGPYPKEILTGAPHLLGMNGLP